MIRTNVSDSAGKRKTFCTFRSNLKPAFLYKVLDGSSTFEDYVPSTRPNASRAEKDAAIDKGREIFKDKQMQIWYELVSALDKQSVLYLRPYKGDGAQAWDVLTKRFHSFERPRLQKLVSELISLVKRQRKFNRVYNKSRGTTI